jgi:hypothetical protein
VNVLICNKIARRKEIQKSSDEKVVQRQSENLILDMNKRYI